MLTVDPLHVDPPPQGSTIDTKCWWVDPLHVDCHPLCVDHRSSPCQLLILSMLIINPPRRDWPSILSILIIDSVHVNHWSSPPPSINPSMINAKCWSLILSMSIIDLPPPRLTQRLLSQNDHAFWHRTPTLNSLKNRFKWKCNYSATSSHRRVIRIKIRQNDLPKEVCFHVICPHFSINSGLWSGWRTKTGVLVLQFK